MSSYLTPKGDTHMKKPYKATIDWPIRDEADADALPEGSVTCGGDGLSYFTKTGEGWKEAFYEDEPIPSDCLVYPRVIISVPANTHITLATDSAQALDIKAAMCAIKYAVGLWVSDEATLRQLNKAGYDIVKIEAINERKVA